MSIVFFIDNFHKLIATLKGTPQRRTLLVLLLVLSIKLLHCTLASIVYDARQVELLLRGYRRWEEVLLMIIHWACRR